MKAPKKTKVPNYDHPIWTPFEVWSYFRISRAKVYDMLRLGKLPHYKIGDNYRILKADLDAWAKEIRFDPEEYK